MSSFRSLYVVSVTAALMALTGCGNPETATTSSPETNSSSSHAGHTDTTAEKPAATEGKKDDVDYMTTLGLMKGHLIVAKELIDEGKPKEAEPHIGHPVEELYGDIEGELPERNVKDFKTTLNKLNDTVKSQPNAPELATQYQEATQEIDGAIEVLPATERQSPEFVLKVINRMLNTAGKEYEAAIADGKITEVVEYQDSRGFVLYSEDLYRNISDQMSKENPEAHQAIETSMTELKTVWPSVDAPAVPVKTPEEVSELIETIKENSQKVS
ncbi:hypothetical protein [Lyngbya aestuarii]|uniref:hypothetical protein n=1 Tax=Lyngbya aestuarii TaxID=118322 RepID=UPI00403DA908